MRLHAIAIVLVAVIASSSNAARADTPRRRTGTRLTEAGAIILMAGAASEGTAAGLSDHPGPQDGFVVTGLALGGVGAVVLVAGLYMRATSPAPSPDAIELDPVRSRHRWERRVGLAIAGAGALVTAVGIAHVVGAVHDHDLADNLCPGGACDADAERLRARSFTLALASGMLLGPGIVGIAGGLAMYESAPDDGPHLVPVAGPDRIGAALVGRF